MFGNQMHIPRLISNIMFWKTEQITAEYKARVLSCHPDKHPGDQQAGNHAATPKTNANTK